jgi:hypothetical protein
MLLQMAFQVESFPGISIIMHIIHLATTEIVKKLRFKHIFEETAYIKSEEH